MDSPIVAECTSCHQLIVSDVPFVTCDQCLRESVARLAEPPASLFTFPPGIFGQQDLGLGS